MICNCNTYRSCFKTMYIIPVLPDQRTRPTSERGFAGKVSTLLSVKKIIVLGPRMLCYSASDRPNERLSFSPNWRLPAAWSRQQYRDKTSPVRTNLTFC